MESSQRELEILDTPIMTSCSVYPFRVNEKGDVQILMRRDKGGSLY
jgi:hypothetical protein